MTEPHRLSQKDTEAKTAVCSVCGQVKIIVRGKTSNGAPRWRCHPHELDLAKQRRSTAEYKEYHRRYSPKWHARNPKKASLWQYHKMSVSEYDQMVKERQNKCDICGEHTENLVVDHDHTTLKTRGLLCKLCNSVLGFARDNCEILTSAVKYLTR